MRGVPGVGGTPVGEGPPGIFVLGDSFGSAGSPLPQRGVGPRGIPGDRGPLVCPPASPRSLGHPCGGGSPQGIPVGGGPWDAPEGKGPPGQVWGRVSPGHPQQCKSPGSPCKSRSLGAASGVRPRSPVGKGPWGTPVGRGPPGHSCKCRTPSETEVPYGWEVLRAPLGEDPLGRGRSPAPHGWRSPGTPRCPGWAPAACQAVGVHGALHSASPGGSHQRRAPVRVCSHPPARVSHTLTTQPQTHCQHPKAGFEKCSSVPAPVQRGQSQPRSSKRSSAARYRAPLPQIQLFMLGSVTPWRQLLFSGGKPEPGGSTEPTTCLGQLLPEINTREVYYGTAQHPSLPNTQPPAFPRDPPQGPGSLWDVGWGCTSRSALNQPCILHRKIRIVHQTQAFIAETAPCCSWPEQEL